MGVNYEYYQTHLSSGSSGFDGIAGPTAPVDAILLMRQARELGLTPVAFLGAGAGCPYPGTFCEALNPPPSSEPPPAILAPFP
jgi:hypothetical protein